MISGLNASGLATAIRTAGKARATMDTMSRQIATGQKVVSVKDDGAAWARAAGIKSSIAARDVYAEMGARHRMMLEVNLAATETASEHMNQMSQLALAGSAARQAGNLQAAAAITAEYGQTVWAASNALTHSVVDGVNVVSPAPWDIPANYVGAGPFGTMGKWQVMPGNAVFGSLTFSGDALGWFVSNAWSALAPGDLLTVNFATSTQATINGVVNGTRLNREVFTQHAHARGTEINAVGRLLDMNGKFQAVEQDSLSTLTDADLGKASAALRAAQTRQQLANQTVQQAIGTYGAYANGLLGNVQRTQRGVLA
jgi:flagellin